MATYFTKPKEVVTPPKVATPPKVVVKTKDEK